MVWVVFLQRDIYTDRKVLSAPKVWLRDMATVIFPDHFQRGVVRCRVYIYMLYITFFELSYKKHEQKGIYGAYHGTFYLAGRYVGFNIRGAAEDIV